MLILQQIQDVMLPYKTYWQSNFCDGFEPLDCDQFLGGIASSFVDLAVGTLCNALEKGVSLDQFEWVHYC